MCDSNKAKQFVKSLAASERCLAGYVLSLVPNFVDADEILQDTKLHLWEQFDRYDPDKDFAAWARTVAYYKVLTFRKKRGRDKVIFSTEFVSTLTDELAGQGDELSDRSKSLLYCIEHLNQKYQTLLREYYGDPSSLQRAAEAVGMTITAARKALERTRESLHECIERRMRQQEARTT